MSILSTILKSSAGTSASTDYSMFNNKIYRVSKGTDESLDVYSDGNKVDILPRKSFVICNDSLASKDFYWYHSNDTLPDMSECRIYKSDEIYYVKCSSWSPNSEMQYPDRILITGELPVWITRKIQVFIKLGEDSKVEFLTNNGEYGVKDRIRNIQWIEPFQLQKNIWYLCSMDQIHEDVYNISVICPMLSDLGIIVHGRMKWDPETCRWEVNNGFNERGAIS